MEKANANPHRVAKATREAPTSAPDPDPEAVFVEFAASEPEPEGQSVGISRAVFEAESPGPLMSLSNAGASPPFVHLQHGSIWREREERKGAALAI